MPKSKKQFFWEFMRRHKRFRVGDAMIALDLSKSYVKQILWQLVGAGYVRLTQRGERYEDRIYTLVKDTGIIAPVLINGKVVDSNTNECASVKRRMPKRLPRRMIPTKLKLLLAMRMERMSKQMIAQKAGVNPHSGSAKRAFRELREAGVLIPCEERIDGKRLFVIDERRKKDEMIRLREELENKKIGRARRRE